MDCTITVEAHGGKITSITIDSDGWDTEPEKFDAWVDNMLRELRETLWDACEAEQEAQADHSY